MRRRSGAPPRKGPRSGRVRRQHLSDCATSARSHLDRLSSGRPMTHTGRRTSCSESRNGKFTRTLCGLVSRRLRGVRRVGSARQLHHHNDAAEWIEERNGSQLSPTRSAWPRSTTRETTSRRPLLQRGAQRQRAWMHDFSVAERPALGRTITGDRRVVTYAVADGRQHLSALRSAPGEDLRDHSAGCATCGQGDPFASRGLAGGGGAPLAGYEVHAKALVTGTLLTTRSSNHAAPFFFFPPTPTPPPGRDGRSYPVRFW